jgi:membrane protein implicated in regulation of membrane protease activity
MRKSSPAQIAVAIASIVAAVALVIVAMRAPSPYWQIAVGVALVVGVVSVVIGTKMARKRQGKNSD